MRFHGHADQLTTRAHRLRPSHRAVNTDCELQLRGVEPPLALSKPTHHCDQHKCKLQ